MEIEIQKRLLIFMRYFKLSKKLEISRAFLQKDAKIR